MDKRAELINDFVASINILASAVDELVQTRFEQEFHETVTFSQLNVLMLVARTESGTITNIASFLRVSLPAASKAVNRLVSQKLIERLQGGADRRKNELALTPKGESVLNEYLQIQREALQSLFPKYSETQVREFTGSIDGMTRTIVHHEHAPKELCYRCGIYFRNKCLRREDGVCTCFPHPFREGK